MLKILLIGYLAPMLRLSGSDAGLLVRQISFEIKT